MIPPIPERRPVGPIGPENAYKFEHSIDEIATDSLSGGGGIIPPLYLEQVDSTNVKVKTGTVGGIIPTGVDTNIPVGGTTTYYVFLTATINAAGDVTAAAISSNTTGVPADISTAAHYLIGTVVTSAGDITAVNPTLMFSQEFAACGRDTADPAATPGTYYFFVA